MNFIPTLLLACAAFACIDPGRAATAEPPPAFANAVAQARESAWKAITSGQGSGATIAIMERGTLVYSEGMGTADRARNRAVDRDTRFNVGSVAKMFAAAATLLLVDDGKLVLDAPVVRYLPEFTMADARHSAITVRMLLNHSAGLPAVTVLVGFEPDRTTHAVLLDTLKRATLKHDPGAMSLYSNDGFTLLEMIVERISGQRYMDFLAERIFTPLRMMHTGPGVGELDPAIDNVAEFYDTASGKRYPREIVPVYAAGALSSTAEDLCRFGNALMPGGTPLLSTASLQELLRPQPAALASATRGVPEFGQFGWDHAGRIGTATDKLLVLSKGGNTPFYTANLQILPEQGVVIALAVSGRASGEKLADPILRGLLRDRGIVIDGGAARPVRAQAIPPALDRYAGYYAMESGALKIEIDRSRRKLILTGLASGSVPLALTYRDGYFHPLAGEPRYYFVSAQGQDLLVASTAGLIAHDNVMFQKLAPVGSPVVPALPMQEQAWLVRNAPSWVETGESLRPMLTSATYAELPGYVSLEGMHRIVRSDFATIAGTAFRDQSDLAFVTVDGKRWLRAANVLRSPANEAPRLAGGASAITIGRDGYNEWRAIAQEAWLRLALPGKRTRALVVAADHVLHDSLVDGNEVVAPAGSYLFFAGAPGDTLAVDSDRGEIERDPRASAALPGS